MLLFQKAALPVKSLLTVPLCSQTLSDQRDAKQTTGAIGYFKAAPMIPDLRSPALWATQNIAGAELKETI